MYQLHACSFPLKFWAKKRTHIDNGLGYYQFIALKHSVFNLYQRMSNISLRKGNAKSNFINITDDLNNKKKKVQFYRLR